MHLIIDIMQIDLEHNSILGKKILPMSKFAKYRKLIGLILIFITI